jgi:hypothetical protein
VSNFFEIRGYPRVNLLPVSTTQAINPCPGFSVIAGDNDTGDKFITGDNDAGDKVVFGDHGPVFSWQFE